MKKQYVFRSLIASLCLIALLLSDASPLSVVRLAEAEATQPQTDALKKERSALSAAQAELQSQLSGARQNRSDAVARKENLDRQLSEIRSEIENVEARVASFGGLIGQTGRETRAARETAGAELESRKAEMNAQLETVREWAADEAARRTMIADKYAELARQQAEVVRLSREWEAQ